MQVEAKDLRVKRRHRLEKVIPLPAPYVVFIEPASTCNFRCEFCPTGDVGLRQRRPNGIMPLGLFKKTVDDMRQFPVKVKRVNLYKDGEPLLNRDIVRMVQYLKAADVTDSIWTKTNGWLLNRDLSAALVDAGMDMIGISVKAVDSDGYRRVSQVDIVYPDLVEKVTTLYKIAQGRCKVYVSIADTGLTDAQRLKFYEDFEGRCDYAAIEGLHGWSASSLKDFTLGTQPTTFDGLPLVEKLVCPWAFYTQAVNWDGSVSICNEDWLHGTVVGNVKESNLLDIWRGERLRQMQVMFLEGRRGGHPVCGDCYYLKCAPDNIDAYREDILRRLNEGS